MPFFIKVSGLSYTFPNGENLFTDINLNITDKTTAIVGNNGSGKTTLLNILAGGISPSAGSVELSGTIALLKQEQIPDANRDVADMLGVKQKITALNRIVAGNGNGEDYYILDNDWEIESRIQEILDSLKLSGLALERKISSLSGGEAERIMLASCLLSAPDFLLLDEPTNHLDMEARNLFYDFIRDYKKGLLIVSHDRQLLRIVDRILELNNGTISSYGGNYDFYHEAKSAEKALLEKKITNAQVELQKQIKLASSVIEAKERQNKNAEKKRDNRRYIKAAINKRRGNAENTLARLGDIYEKKINSIAGRLDELKNNLPPDNIIKIDIDAAAGKKKNLITVNNVNYSYGTGNIWPEALSFNIKYGERVLFAGNNRSGKTTLVNLILGKLAPAEGNIIANTNSIGIIDQRYEILSADLSILENMRIACNYKLPEHELRIRLARFKFYGHDANKTAGRLSGGEKCRLAMACLLASSNSPNLIILDEPTNNLDLDSIEQMQAAFANYRGAVILITHDEDFARNFNINKTIDLNKMKVMENGY